MLADVAAEAKPPPTPGTVRGPAPSTTLDIQTTLQTTGSPRLCASVSCKKRLSAVKPISEQALFAYMPEVPGTVAQRSQTPRNPAHLPDQLRLI